MMISEFEPGPEIPWHALPVEAVYEKLSTGPKGLTDEECDRRMGQYGPNILPVKEPPGILAIFLHQFKSPLIYILLVAAIVSFVMQDLKDGIFIIIVVLLNATIGLGQEWKAEQSATNLKSLITLSAHLRRDGKDITVDSADIVPGDIVLIESGNHVPADLRLIHDANLVIDESLLTGESIAVEKSLGLISKEAPIAERKNMAFAGCTVMNGRGMGVVTATGLRTELGLIAEAVVATEASKAPLLIRMEHFSRNIGIFVIAACFLMAAVSLAQGVYYMDVFFLVVALAVSAIPEGLPVAVTVALSIGSSRMARRNVIIRRLAAVESLGSCTMIATDKTGTLTVNQQTVKKIILPEGSSFDVTGAGYNGIGEVRRTDGTMPDPASLACLKTLGYAAAICNEGSLYQEDEEWVYHGDAMDVGLLSLAMKIGIDPDFERSEIRVVRNIPFEPELRYSAVYYQDENNVNRVIVKGAFETLLPFCQSMQIRDRIVPFDSDRVKEQLHVLTQQSYRVLAIAEGIIDAVPAGPLNMAKVQPTLTFLGLTGFTDPIRPDVPKAIVRCKNAGVEVSMITGDHPNTAFAIGKQLGLVKETSKIVTGHELEAIGSPDLPEYFERVRSGRIFARMSPIQKLEIVDNMVRDGHFVAVTGDGVNDAPALRRANIGVAMGSGTDVTKDTASIIIADDNFSSIVAGIEEGRYAYENIRKVTYLLISTGFAEIVLFTFALAIGFPLPLLAVQLLWLNLVTNGIQDVTLAFERGDVAAMHRRPRDPKEGIFNRLMIQETLISGFLMGIIAFGAYFWLLSSGTDEFTARSILVLLMVLLENFHALNCRSEYRSLFRIPIKNNYYLIVGILVAQGVHIVAMMTPVMQDILSIGPVDPATWVSLLALASLLVVSMELFKWAKFRKGSLKDAPY
jgi:Ca2+-transporting ATPase